ncbi:hypothetical protein EDB92DRAFT_1820201 [Lactarius akahatsu]|uniref:Uncharacterized protein n=1 Tax=Lactarius akahatsu TaxID=416441 RepID=A0AAD4Q933_9AGAM|nr:hypothetical protein EDB92DRAFT_1820201 [Lactarius akahatsu]
MHVEDRRQFGRLSLYLYTTCQRGLVDPISGPPGFYFGLGKQFRFADKVVAAAPTWINGSWPGVGGVRDTACTWRRSTPATGCAEIYRNVTTKFAFAKREERKFSVLSDAALPEYPGPPSQLPYRSAPQHTPQNTSAAQRRGVTRTHGHSAQLTATTFARFRHFARVLGDVEITSRSEPRTFDRRGHAAQLTIIIDAATALTRALLFLLLFDPDRCLPAAARPVRERRWGMTIGLSSILGSTDFFHKTLPTDAFHCVGSTHPHTDKHPPPRPVCRCNWSNNAVQVCLVPGDKPDTLRHQYWRCLWERVHETERRPINALPAPPRAPVFSRDILKPKSAFGRRQRTCCGSAHWRKAGAATQYNLALTIPKSGSSCPQGGLLDFSSDDRIRGSMRHTA